MQNEAAHYVTLAEEARREMFGPNRRTWFERLEREYDDFQAALQWLATHEEAESGLRLAIGLREFWNYNRWDEGRQWLETFLDMPQAEIDPSIRAQAIDDAGALIIDQAEWGTQYARFEQALAIRREIGDKQKIAVSLIHLGNHKLYFERDYETARPMYEECLVLFEELESRVGIAYAHSGLGHLAYAQADYPKATMYFTSSLETLYDIEDVWAINFKLMDFAGLAIQHQQPYRALRLAGATEALRESIYYVIPAGTFAEAREQRLLEPAWSALDKEVGEAAWAEGRAMTLAQAVAYALETDATN